MADTGDVFKDLIAISSGNVQVASEGVRSFNAYANSVSQPGGRHSPSGAGQPSQAEPGLPPGRSANPS